MDEPNVFAEEYSDEIRKTLENIDWSFYANRSDYGGNIRPFDVRKYHGYPATFVPEIPFALTEVLSSPGATVYDPFAGIGTTYFQSLLLNRKPIATEICEVAVRFMRNLLTLLDPTYDVEKVRESLLSKVEEYSKTKDYTSEVPDHILMDELKPWYSKNTFKELSFLFTLESDCECLYEKAATRILIPSILTPLCAQDRGLNSIADNMKPSKEQLEKYSNKSAIQVFRKEANIMMKDIQENLNIKNKDFENLYNEISDQSSIHHTNIVAQNPIPEKSVDLVITSPPYPEMTDYVSSQRLPYYWLGKQVDLSFDESDMNQEIGARRKRFRNSSHEDYLSEMKKANRGVISAVKEHGYLCYILPVINDADDNRREIIRQVLGHIDGNTNIIKEDEYTRTLHPTQRVHNIQWTTLDKERIIIFKKY